MHSTDEAGGLTRSQVHIEINIKIEFKLKLFGKTWRDIKFVWRLDQITIDGPE
jgi:hypothetical protein